jgi:hypothetical protein
MDSGLWFEAVKILKEKKMAEKTKATGSQKVNGAVTGAAKKVRASVELKGESIELGDFADSFGKPRSKYDQELDKLVADTKAAEEAGKDPLKVGRVYSDLKAVVMLKKRAGDRGIKIQSGKHPKGIAVRLDPDQTPVAVKVRKAKTAPEGSTGSTEGLGPVGTAGAPQEEAGWGSKHPQATVIS